MNRNILKEQGIPLLLTILTFFIVSIALFIAILILNLFPTSEKILLHLRLGDILVGLTIYLKTSIDFAIFIGNLMKTNPGWKKRIAIEGGTAMGNAAGTLLILIIWTFFKEVPLLMIIMIAIASLVLFRMAEESIGEFIETRKPNTKTHHVTSLLHGQLGAINKIFKPVLGRLIPNAGVTNLRTLSFVSLGIFSFTIPFILGLDDFAGYIPLFSIINVFGFCIGIFLGHMILNLSLFLSPSRTVQLVKMPIILLLGGVAFLGIGIWGFFEAFLILFRFLHVA